MFAPSGFQATKNEIHCFSPLFSKPVGPAQSRVNAFDFDDPSPAIFIMYPNED
jgi:hypothetical protein